MKKLIGLIVLLSSLTTITQAAPREIGSTNPYSDTFGPQTFTSLGAVSSAQIQIAAPATGVRNCLTDAWVSLSTSSFLTNISLCVLDGGTTVYTVSASTANIVPIHLQYDAHDPLCITPGHTLGVTGTGQVNAQIQVSVKGYAY